MKFAKVDEQKELFRKFRKIAATHQASRTDYPSIRVAILSGVTLQPLSGILETILLEHELNPSMFLGDYDSYRFDARFSKPLQSFNPEIVYIHTSKDNLQKITEISFDPPSAEQVLKENWEDISSTIDAVLANTQADVIINNFELPNYRISGNIEAVAHGGTVRHIHAINQRLSDLARDNPRVFLNDLNYLSALVGLENWRDDHGYIAFKQPFSSRAVTEIARSVASIMCALRGKANKCLVLDLDNTLWGGVIGDDGIDNVHIGPNTPQGEAYHYFQTAIRPLLGRGIAFAVSSKNEYENGIGGLNRKEMVLKEQDFHILKINWDTKSANIKDIRDKLNIGMDSIVFLDDSSFERDEVRFSLPTLNVIESAPDPLEFMQAISRSYSFETSAITHEDLTRSENFHSMIEVNQRPDTQDQAEFLKQLKMKCSITSVTQENRERVHQLINKTNQFNLSGERLTQADVEHYLFKDLMLCASIQDKNTDYGLVSVLWGDVTGITFNLRNWVMSCRVFNRKLEHHFFDQLVSRLAANGIRFISGQYVPTSKNTPVATLLFELGFAHDTNGGEHLVYDTARHLETFNNQHGLTGIFS